MNAQGRLAVRLLAAARPYLGGVLSVDELLRAVALFGLTLALTLIIHRRSIALALLFLATLVIIWYIEYGGGAELLTKSLKHEDAFRSSKKEL